MAVWAKYCLREDARGPNIGNIFNRKVGPDGDLKCYDFDTN